LFPMAFSFKNSYYEINILCLFLGVSKNSLSNVDRNNYVILYYNCMHCVFFST
jgi:hypothetical protein